MQLIDDLVTENAELQQQLTRKEAELTGAVETARREQQQVRHTCTYKRVLVMGLPWDFSSPQHVTQFCRVCALDLFKFSLFNLQELQQQLQSSEREKQMLRQQLTRKEAELTGAVETAWREQQQVRQLQHTCSRVSVCL